MKQVVLWDCHSLLHDTLLVNMLNENIGLPVTVLQLWTLYGLLHRLHHWDLPLRPDKKFNDLVDKNCNC